MPDTDTGRRVAQKGFGLGSRSQITLLSQGRINLTFLVETQGTPYILQRLHPVFGSDGAVVENTAMVADALQSAGMPAPTVIPAVDGRKWVHDQGIWRLTRWLPGRTIDRRSGKATREAARLLGRFHRILAQVNPSLRELPPAEYKQPPRTAGAWETLIRAKQGDPKFINAKAALEKGRALAENLPVFTPAAALVVHGDPKLENILFSEQGRALAMIDLDTVRRDFLLWELADALRSWAAVPAGTGQKVFDPRLFDVAMAAYQNDGIPLSAREWSQVVPGVKAITLNLAWRYLADYFEESYFAWDQRHYPSLAQQNLQRGAQYIQMVEAINEPTPKRPPTGH